MNVWKLVFLTLAVINCFASTYAMGICGFAAKFPRENNESLVSAKTTGYKSQSQAGKNKQLQNSATTEELVRSHTTASTSIAMSMGMDQTTIVPTPMLCPLNMVYSNCTTCQGSCLNPYKCITNCSKPQTCVCREGFLLNGSDCIHETKCKCFVNGIGVVPENDETYIDVACTKTCVCQGDKLMCNFDYQCSPHAACKEEDGVRRCYCNQGYEGDGETCTPMPKDCYDLRQAGHTRTGVYTILPKGWPGSPFKVYCDMDTTGGGWTVFQRRVDDSTDFHRNWTSYKNGFGLVQDGRDFWLGNEKVYYLTNKNEINYKLRVDIITSGWSEKYQEYADFRIDDESTKYKLVGIGTSSGTAGDGMLRSKDLQFSTYDSDNDNCENFNCAMEHRGGWWHDPFIIINSDSYCTGCYTHPLCDQFSLSNGCNAVCTFSNLNGVYNGVNGQNIFWNVGNNCHVRSVEMKLRPYP